MTIDPKHMTPSHVIATVVELRRRLRDGEKAGGVFLALDYRLSQILAPLEGKVLKVWHGDQYQSFLVEDGDLVAYTKPEVIYITDLDVGHLAPRDVAVAGRHEPLRIHELDSQVA